MEEPSQDAVPPAEAEPGRYAAFVCYAREDKGFAAERLRAALIERGKTVWIDVRDILPGAQWRDRVRRGIEACAAFIFVIGPDSVASQQCGEELADALALNKRIIPVVHRDVDEGRLPQAVADTEWVFLRERDDFGDGIAALVDALDTDLEWRDEHTRLAGRAREWLDADRNKSFLLRGTDLRDAEAWLAQQAGHREVPTAEQAEYIVDSRRASTRRQRTLLAGVIGGLLVAVALAVFALIQRNHAIDQAHVSQSQLLAKSSIAHVRDDWELASLLGLEAHRISPTLDARDAILHAASGHELGPPLFGHAGPVRSVAFSPDGRTLASAGADRAIRLWDTATHRPRGAPLAAGDVHSIAFSPRGGLLAAGGADGAVRLWDVASGRRLDPPFSGHAGEVTSVAFSPDGATLASGGSDRTVRLWDVSARRPLGRALLGHVSGVADVAFSPDGRTLVSASEDRTVVWDVTRRRPEGAPLAAGGVNSVAFSPDGAVIALAGEDRPRLWDVATRRPLGRPLSGHSGFVSAVAFSPDGASLATAGEDQTVRIWDLDSRRQVGPALTGHAGAVSAVAFSPDGGTLASGGEDRTVRLWSAASRRQVGRPLVGHEVRVLHVDISPDGRTLASTSDDGTVRLWDVKRHRAVGAPIAADGVSDVAFSPDGRTLAMSGSDSALWDAATRRPSDSSLDAADALSVAFSPNGKTLALGGFDGTVLWDVPGDRQVGRALSTGDAAVNGVAFAPDGTLLATADDGGAVRLWSLESRRPLGRPLTGHEHAVTSVAFSPDGQTLASAGVDRTVRLWDVGDRRQLGPPLTGNAFGVNGLAFTRDGRTLASAGADGTIRLWDVAARRQLGAPLTGHVGSVNDVVFGPSGDVLASAGEDRTVRLWNDLPIASYARRLCAFVDQRRARLLLTRAEPSVPFHRPC